MSHFIQNTLNQEQAMQVFMHHYYYQTKSKETFQNLLKDIGNYYQADCIYVLELDNEGTYIYNTFQWYQNAHKKDFSTTLAIDYQYWFDKFEHEGEFSISFKDNHDLLSTQILKQQNVECLMAAPIIINGLVRGLIGVDQPRRHTHDILLLAIIASTYFNEVSKKWQSDLSFENLPVDRIQIIQSLSEIYTSVYYIDIYNNHFIELSSFQNVHAHIGESGDAQERLNYFCHHMMVPEHQDDMLEFVDLSTLPQRLKQRRIVSKQYLSTVMVSLQQGNKPTWSQCSFIESKRDAHGQLTHVLFATQSIQESKIKELEIQKELIETNNHLSSLLAIEKQHTAIIDSLGNIFSSLYYIDLENNSVQNIVSIDQKFYALAEKENARACLKAIIEQDVSFEYVPLMRIFTDYDTIDSRLGNKRILIQEYINKEGEWYRSNIIPVERNEDGKNIHVIMGFRNVTFEKKATETQDNLILALAMSYENVYFVNTESGEAVCYRMGQVMSDRYGEKFAIGNYEQNIQFYIEHDVYKEDQALFENMQTIQGADELLSDRKTYYFNYRVLRNDRIQYFQCQLVKPNEKRNEFVVAFKNINEEKMKELKQQRKIEEALTIVEQMNATLQEEMVVSEALSQEYQSLFKIDVKTGKMSLYRTDRESTKPRVIENLLSLNDYEKILSQYIETYVVVEDQHRLREFSKMDVLLERVPEVGLYKLGYRRIMDGIISYFEMNIVKTVDLNQQITFIMGIRDVDEEMRRQLKITREMETQREIIEGLGSEYYSVLLVDPKKDTVTTYRAQEGDGQDITDYFKKHHNCWSKGLYSYSQELVSKESREEFLQKLSLDYISAYHKDYSLTYEKLSEHGIVYLQARVSYVYEKDGSLAVVIGTRNVDDLIKKERQQEMALKEAYDAAEAANRAKTDFLSNMSHDIRTPMNGIIGMTAIAGAHIDDKERVLDSLQKINQASKHLLSLINEVLDMSKIESGKVQLIEEEFNLSDLIDNLLNMMNSQIEEHHHELSVNITGVRHEAVIGDSLRIQKVFTNLMGNAVKFTPDGGKIRISISEQPSRQAKVGCYKFVFEDNGIGMSEEFLDHIFEPFARAEDSQINHIQGTGLGMPISRNIVRMMGGDIKVESQLGVGSRFTVTIYLKLQDVINEHYDKFIDLDVLVVDDDAMSLDSCCQMLCDLGMKAEGVSTGRKAVERVVEHHEIHQDYFACIIDWKMPDMDGIETTRAIRRAVGNDVPIIIFSAYDWADIEQVARQAGANVFISKPLFRSRLAKTFHTLLDDEDVSSPEMLLDDIEKIDLTGRRALLVEDNELNAEIAIEILKMTGLEMERAHDGIEAVDIMTESPNGYYDVIFMDIQMPRMNGYDATRAIRAMKRNDCQQIPIIAMTANAFAEDVIAAKTVGMNEHIAKPFDLKILARTLNKWLKK